MGTGLPLQAISLVRVSHPHASTAYATLQCAASPTCYSHDWPSESVCCELSTKTYQIWAWRIAGCAGVYQGQNVFERSSTFLLPPRKKDAPEKQPIPLGKHYFQK